MGNLPDFFVKGDMFYVKKELQKISSDSHTKTRKHLGATKLRKCTSVSQYIRLGSWRYCERLTRGGRLRHLQWK